MRLHEETSDEDTGDEETSGLETSQGGRHRQRGRQMELLTAVRDGIPRKGWHPQKTSILLYLEIIIHSTPYMNGRATTLGVLKRMRFFLN